MAFDYAQRSRDFSTQNGAIIIGQDGKVKGAGWNDIPEKVSVTTERQQRPLKYSTHIHAETRAVVRSLGSGGSIAGSTMYACWAACANCALVIIESGIKAVYSSRRMFENSSEDWQRSIAVGLEMFEEAGVDYILLDHHFESEQLRFNGHLWRP